MWPCRQYPEAPVRPPRHASRRGHSAITVLVFVARQYPSSTSSSSIVVAPLGLLEWLGIAEQVGTFFGSPNEQRLHSVHPSQRVENISPDWNRGKRQTEHAERWHDEKDDPSGRVCIATTICNVENKKYCDRDVMNGFRLNVDVFEYSFHRLTYATMTVLKVSSSSSGAFVLRSV